MHCLSSAAVKTSFCRNVCPTDYIQCQPTKNIWPMASQLVDDNLSMAGGSLPWPVASQNDQGVVQKHQEYFHNA